MLPPGLSAKVTSLRLRFGGFLTWAAKPSVRESPDPAIDIESLPARSPLPAVYPLHAATCFPWSKFPSRLLPSCFYLDAARILPVAKFWIQRMKRIWNRRDMFC